MAGQNERFAREFSRTLRRAAREVPWAAVRAINRTAIELRDEMRTRVGEVFEIRKPAVQQLGIWIPKGGFARRGQLEAIVEVNPRFRFLVKHEKGGTIRARSPVFGIAVPTEHARTGARGSVPLGLYPKNLRLEARRDVTGILAAKSHRTRRGVTVFRGKRRTFLLTPAHHFTSTWGIFQRTGKRRQSVRLLWAFQHQVHYEPRLGFEDTARRLVPRRLPEIFVEEYRAAIAKRFG